MSFQEQSDWINELVTIKSGGGFSYYFDINDYGGVSERFKETVSKTVGSKGPRGFKSHPLRHKIRIQENLYYNFTEGV